MSRTVSQRFRDLVFAQHGDDAIEILLTITHPALGTPLYITSGHPNVGRLSTDPLLYGTVSRGNTYQFVPFDIGLPDDDGDKPPAMEINLGNVGRETVPFLRSVRTSALFTVEIVLARYPDSVEITFPVFRLASANYDAQSVTLSLVTDDLTSEAFPPDRFSAARFPGLF